LAEAHLSAKFGPNIFDFFDLVNIPTFIWSPQKLFLSQIYLLFLSTLLSIRSLKV
jgi:hypothetical protein